MVKQIDTINFKIICVTLINDDYSGSDKPSKKISKRVFAICY